MNFKGELSVHFGNHGIGQVERHCFHRQGPVKRRLDNRTVDT
jgi:hypothetical protein